jgi:hypothetical protein
MEATRTHTPSRWGVNLRRSEFEKALSEAVHGDPDKKVSITVAARFLGLGYGTIQRLRAGDQKPGEAFMSAVRNRLGVPLEQVFDFGSES